MTTKNLQQIKCEEIFADEEFNCRGQLRMTDVTELAQSIEKQGLIQPISIMAMTDDTRKAADEQAITDQQKLAASKYKYYLLAGFRRFLAHRLLEREVIDAIIIEKQMTNAEQIAFNLSENLARKELNVLQEAKTIEKLFHQGYTENQIMEMINKGRGWVQIRGMLLRLPVAVQESVALGEIKQNDIRKVYTVYHKTGSEAECIAFAKKIKEGRKSGRAPVMKAKNAKKHRTKGDMLTMMDHLVKSKIPMGLHSRMLAWCAGEISDNDLYTDLESEATDLGIEYTRPELAA